MTAVTPAICITDCGSPSVKPGNITVDMVNGNTKYDSVAVFTCAPGHVIDGVYTVSMAMVCGDNGTWVGTVSSPICVYVGKNLSSFIYIV